MTWKIVSEKLIGVKVDWNIQSLPIEMFSVSRNLLAPIVNDILT